jgi:hypothetical protein
MPLTASRSPYDLRSPSTLIAAPAIGGDSR